LSSFVSEKAIGGDPSGVFSCVGWIARDEGAVSSANEGFLSIVVLSSGVRATVILLLGLASRTGENGLPQIPLYLHGDHRQQCKVEVAVSALNVQVLTIQHWSLHLVSSAVGRCVYTLDGLPAVGLASLVILAFPCRCVPHVILDANGTVGALQGALAQDRFAGPHAKQREN
jgi:hypothetical protein